MEDRSYYTTSTPGQIYKTLILDRAITWNLHVVNTRKKLYCWCDKCFSAYRWSNLGTWQIIKYYYKLLSLLLLFGSRELNYTDILQLNHISARYKHFSPRRCWELQTRPIMFVIASFTMIWIYTWEVATGDTNIGSVRKCMKNLITAQDRWNHECQHLLCQISLIDG